MSTPQNLIEFSDSDLREKTVGGYLRGDSHVFIIKYADDDYGFLIYGSDSSSLRKEKRGFTDIEEATQVADVIVEGYWHHHLWQKKHFGSE